MLVFAKAIFAYASNVCKEKTKKLLESKIGFLQKTNKKTPPGRTKIAKKRNSLLFF
jgi:hypothetical protein